MGKRSGSSWLTAVKRAFRSPTKGNESKRSKREEEHDPRQEEEKKREKRRWPFRKSNNSHADLGEAKKTPNGAIPVDLGTEKRHAIEVAAATAAAAEAAVATAQAAVEIARLTRPSSFIKEQYAAVVIQTAFRGYLARTALRALKGLVKLQALVRGQNVRRQANLTLKCMQALVRVQDQVRDQRARHSYETSRNSMFAEANNLWESFEDIRNRNSSNRDISCTADYWDDRPYTSEDFEALWQSRKEAALKREKALAYAFSNQIWRSRRNPSMGEERELEERANWLDRWMATRQWDSSGRACTDQREAIKTVEVDTSSRPCSRSGPPHFRRSQYHCYQHKHSNRAQQSSHPSSHSPATPSPCRVRTLQVRSASPRCVKERCHSAAQTPSLPAGAALPNYMAATESAKARIRSQSAPKQRPSTPERERAGSAKKRLNYPPVASESIGGFGIGRSSFSHNLRSPSFKSVQCGGHFGTEQGSNFSSCYTDSLGGEISPCSTTDLRWLK